MSEANLQALAAAAESRPALLRLLRPYQWCKNLALFLPGLIAAPSAPGVSVSGLAYFAQPTSFAYLEGFAVFSLLASSGYVFNDLCDAENDRRDPAKRFRPLASRELSARAGALFGLGLLLAAMVAAFRLFRAPFILALASYFLLTLVYSLGLKKIRYLDVAIIAGLSTLRIAAGGALAAIPVDPGLLLIFFCAFLSLAVLKRCAQLRLLPSSLEKMIGRGYRRADLRALPALGRLSGAAAVALGALYVRSPAIAESCRMPWLLWSIPVIVGLWLARLWRITARGEMPEEPIFFVLKDPASYLLLFAFLGVFAAARIGWP